MIAPKMREMDEKEVMDKEIVTGLFENGVCLIKPCRPRS